MQHTGWKNARLVTRAIWAHARGLFPKALHVLVYAAAGVVTAARCASVCTSTTARI